MRKATLIDAVPLVLAIVLGLTAMVATPASAQEEKVLRIPMTTVGPGTLDPISGSTTYDNRACCLLYDTLLQYKYFVRPLELEPALLAEMPVVSADGTTWSFKLKKGIRFHDDPCFSGGKGRELVASDVFYSWKRLADPKHRYKNWWLVKDLIKGFDQYKEDSAGGIDYDADVEGFELVNDHEFRVHLNKPNQQFQWRLAMFQFSIVPREAVETYGDDFNRRPVGTGPFILRREADWQNGVSLTLHKNPTYRDEFYPDEFEEGAKADPAEWREAAGAKLPIVDKIEFSFYVESQPMWLGFEAGNLDFTTVPADNFFDAFSRRNKELRRSWERRGISAQKVPLLDFIFRGFNMDDELVGGYTPEKRALRQAINLAIDQDELNEARYNGTVIVYDGPIPPGLDGHPENHTAPNAYRGPDYERARSKLQEAGYTIGSDGKVTDLPVIEFYTSRGAESEKIVAVIQRNLETVGIRLNVRYVDFPTLIEKVNNKKAPMFSFAWGSDYPDAENNLALFYGPNESPGSNHFNYKRAEYDRMYERAVTMPPGPERTALYVRMRDMIIEDTPYSGSMARTRSYLIHPWVKNFKATEDFYDYPKYMDVDMNHPDRGDN